MSNFETWWEREGQEFLYALNTTTDDDIKLVAEVAWKNGAYCAEQAEREPVAIADGTFNHNCPIGTPLYAAPVQQVTRADLKAAFKEGFERAADLYALKDEQEPVACPHGVDDGACKECYMEQTDYFDYGLEEVEDYLRNCCNNNFMADKLSDIRKSIYAAPVRTKDLTDDEICKANKTELPDCQDLVDFARAVIAADREKNK